MNNKLDYMAPELYLVYVTVDKGYANSLENPNENEEMDW